MNATFTKELIFDRIKDSGYPFWSLVLSQGFKNTANVMQYWGSDFEDTDSDETKIEKSIKRLDNVVMSFPPESLFIIEIKNGKNATGSGVLGPFQFYAVAPSAQTETKTLSGIPDGYVPQSMLKGLEENLQRQFDARFEALKTESERREREKDFQRRERELEERERELKDLEKGYKSDVAKATDVLLGAGKAIIKYLVPGLNEQTTAAAAPALGTVDEPQDEKSKAVDDLAEYLYKNFDVQSINKLYSNLIKTKGNGTSNMEKQNNTTSAETND